MCARVRHVEDGHHMSPRLYRQIADLLAEQILAGRYGVGGKLPTERMLASQYKVSRPTVREALIVLEAQRWIEVRHGSGVFVVRTDQAYPFGETSLETVDVFDVLEARTIVESGIAAIVATVATAAELDELCTLGERIEAGSATCAEAEQRFHVSLAEITGNAQLVGQVRGLWTLMEKAGSEGCATLFPSEGDKAAHLHVYVELLASLKSRNPVTASNAMRKVIGAFRDRVLYASECELLKKFHEDQALRRAEMRRRLACLPHASLGEL